MKTLNEEINDIKNANNSKAAKKAALAKLGITPYEIDIILDGVECATRGRFTFGVEMECFVNRGAIRTAAERTGMAYEYENYNHRDGHDYFKFTTDSSVRGMADPIECVSPVLSGTNGKRMLKAACKTLNTANANVNHTCGLHVHIGAANLTDKQFANVFANYAMLEAVIDTFMSPSRRNNEYALSIQSQARYIMHANSVSEVQDALRNRRYWKINPMAYNRHKTIEFRQHAGTTNYDKIINWVTFCGKLVIWSKKNRLTAPVASIDEIPFLNADEKAFFKGRAAQFANR